MADIREEIYCITGHGHSNISWISARASYLYRLILSVFKREARCLKFVLDRKLPTFSGWYQYTSSSLLILYRLFFAPTKSHRTLAD